MPTIRKISKSWHPESFQKLADDLTWYSKEKKNINFSCIKLLVILPPGWQTKIQITEQIPSGNLNYKYYLIEAEIKISRARYSEEH